MGVEQLVIRIPEEWDAAWFQTFIRDVLSNMDPRNGTAGDGVSISGSASERVTIEVAPSSAVALLNQTIAGPSIAEVQAISDKVDEIITKLGLDA